MSAVGQYCTQTLVDAGANVHAIFSYNYNALHRMASNDLEIGAEVLVKAGVDPNSKVRVPILLLSKLLNDRGQSNS